MAKNVSNYQFPYSSSIVLPVNKNLQKTNTPLPVVKKKTFSGKRCVFYSVNSPDST